MWIWVSIGKSWEVSWCTFQWPKLVPTKLSWTSTKCVKFHCTLGLSVGMQVYLPEKRPSLCLIEVVVVRDTENELWWRSHGSLLKIRWLLMRLSEKYLKLESSHPDHDEVPCDTKNNGQREEDDGHVVHDDVNVHTGHRLIFGLQRHRSDGRHCVPWVPTEKQEDGHENIWNAFDILHWYLPHLGGACASLSLDSERCDSVTSTHSATHFCKQGFRRSKGFALRKRK